MANNDENDQRGLRRMVSSLPFIGTTGSPSHALSSGKSLLSTAKYNTPSPLPSSSVSSSLSSSSVISAPSPQAVTTTTHAPSSTPSSSTVSTEHHQQPILINSSMVTSSAYHHPYHHSTTTTNSHGNSSNPRTTSSNTIPTTVQSTIRNTLRGTASFRKESSTSGAVQDDTYTNKIDFDAQEWAEAYGSPSHPNTTTTTSNSNHGKGVSHSSTTETYTNTITTNVIGSAAVSDLHRGYTSSSSSTASSQGENPTPTRRSTSTLSVSKDDTSNTTGATDAFITSSTDASLPTKRKGSEPPSPPKDKDTVSTDSNYTTSSTSGIISSMASYLPGNLLPSVLTTLPAAVATLPTAILRKGQNALGLQNYMYPSSVTDDSSNRPFDSHRSTSDTSVLDGKDYMDPDTKDAIQYLQYIRENASVRFEETMLRQAQLAADYHRMCDEQGIIIASLEKQLQHLHDTHDKLRAQYNDQTQDIQQLLMLLAQWRTEYLEYNSDYLPSQIDTKYSSFSSSLLPLPSASSSLSSTTVNGASMNPSLPRVNSSSGNMTVDTHTSNPGSVSTTHHLPHIHTPSLPSFVTINGHRYSLPSSVNSSPSSPHGSAGSSAAMNDKHVSEHIHSWSSSLSGSTVTLLSRRQTIARTVNELQQFLQTYDTSSRLKSSSSSPSSTMESKENGNNVTVSFDTVPIDWSTVANSLYQLLINVEELASTEIIHQTADVEARSLVKDIEYSGVQLRSIDITAIEKKEHSTEDEHPETNTSGAATTTTGLGDKLTDTDTVKRSDSLIVRNRHARKDLFDTFISAPYRCNCACHAILAEGTTTVSNARVHPRRDSARSSPLDLSVPILVENPYNSSLFHRHPSHSSLSSALSDSSTLRIDIPSSTNPKALHPSFGPPGAIPRENHPSPYAGKPVVMPENIVISAETDEQSRAIILRAIDTPSAESVTSFNGSNSIFGTTDGAFSDTSSVNTPEATKDSTTGTSQGYGILYDNYAVRDGIPSNPPKVKEYPITEADVQEALKEANQTLRDSPLHTYRTTDGALVPSSVTSSDDSSLFPDAVENEAAGLLSVLALEKVGAEATEARIRAETEGDDTDDLSDEVIDSTNEKGESTETPASSTLPPVSSSVPKPSTVLLSSSTLLPSLTSSSIPLARLYRVPTRGLRILSLDGGGIRGLLMIEFLKKIEADTGRRIWELFDLIAGTSTGGMCALALACHRSLEDIAKQYHMIRSTFEGQSAVWSEVKRIAVGASHSTEKAEAVLRSFFGDVRLSDTPVNPKVVVVSAAVDQYPAQPYLFRNYELTKEAKKRTHYLGTSGVSVFEAARATTSAPTFYEPAKVGNLRLVDGAIIANNPSLVALAEAAALFPGANIDALVSLGTGTVSLRAVNTNNIVSWARIAMECVLSADPVHRTTGTLLGPDKYFRFDPESLGDIELSELRLEIIQKMLEEGRRYIHRNEGRFKELRYALGIQHHHHRRRPSSLVANVGNTSVNTSSTGPGTGNGGNGSGGNGYVTKPLPMQRKIVDLGKVDGENSTTLDESTKHI